MFYLKRFLFGLIIGFFVGFFVLPSEVFYFKSDDLLSFKKDQIYSFELEGGHNGIYDYIEHLHFEIKFENDTYNIPAYLDKRSYPPLLYKENNFLKNCPSNIWYESYICKIYMYGVVESYSNSEISKPSTLSPSSNSYLEKYLIREFYELKKRLNKISSAGINGYYVFNAPETVLLENFFTIKLILSEDRSKNELNFEISSEINEGSLIGKAKSDSMLLPSGNESKIIDAELSGGDFDIQLQGGKNSKRTLSHGEAQWSWNVKALKVGRQGLTLTIKTYEKELGEIIPRILEIKNHYINVKVSKKQWWSRLILSPEWQWLWGAIIIPVLGGIWMATQWVYRRWKAKPQQ